MQAHEGDWEMVTVLVRNGRPVTVGYSQHCTGERRPWAAVERWQGSTHPVVYVAAGSHANLFAAGEHPIAQQCIPPQAIALLQQARLPLPSDHAHPAGVAYGPPGLAGVTPTVIRRVTAGEPHWDAVRRDLGPGAGGPWTAADRHGGRRRVAAHATPPGQLAVPPAHAVQLAAVGVT